MARLIGGIGISHTPSMGIEYDKGMANGWSDPWKIWFDALQPVKAWLKDMAPDKLMVVYNDHLNHFDFAAYPTLAIGIADEFAQADEGWGLRPYPSLPGSTTMGIHMTNALVRDDFDLTVCQELSIDHGIYSWLPYLMESPWTVPMVPLAVNMVRHPIPSFQRLLKLGGSLGDAIRAMPGDERVLVIGTGGMSHQICGGRFGIANEAFDRWFLDHLKDDMDLLVGTPVEEYMRLGGADAAELGIWFAMRGALSDDIRQVHDFNTFPALTGCGVIAFEENG